MRTAVSEDEDRFKQQIEIAKRMLNKSKCLLILTDRVNESYNFLTNKICPRTFLIN
jgi:hypothetical protein